MIKRIITLMFVLFWALSSMALAQTESLGTKAVELLHKEHQADIQELVKLWAPVQKVNKEMLKYMDLSLTEATKPNMDRIALRQYQNTANNLSAKAEKLKDPYLKKLDMVTEAIFVKVDKNALKGEKLKNAKNEIKTAIHKDVGKQTSQTK